MKSVWKIKKRKNNTFKKNRKNSLRQTKMEKIAFALEHSRFLEYIDATSKPKWLVLRHFAIGAARGVGLTVGTALVIAIAIWLLQKLISMNIPYLTEMLTEFVQFVKQAAITVPTPDVSDVK